VSDNIMTVHKEGAGALGHFSVLSMVPLSLLPSALKFSRCTLLLQLSRRDLNIRGPHSRKIILDRYNRQFAGKTDAIPLAGDRI